MFTGIIRHVGQVRKVQQQAVGKRFTIDLGPLAANLALGDSVAVNGVCLTASAISAPAADFDVIAETLRCSILGDIKTGDKVNLELAVRMDQGLDGHIVQGHVDGVATVQSVSTAQPWITTFRADRSLVDQMIPKGSVSINGVSLTLADAEGETFSVALIPTTLGETTLANLRPGDKVNIETDVIGKYVRRYIQNLAQPTNGGLTLEKLKNAGFM